MVSKGFGRAEQGAAATAWDAPAAAGQTAGVGETLDCVAEAVDADREASGEGVERCRW